MTVVEVIVVIGAVLLGATVKSVTGLGLPIIAIPIISLVTDPETAIAVIAIPNAAHNLVLAFRARSHRADTIGLGRVAGAGIVGAVIGALLLGVVADEAVQAVLVVLLGSYLFSAARSSAIGIGREAALRWAPIAGFVGGLFQGGAGISGPIVGTWHHALGLTRGAFVLSVASIFFLTGSAQVAVFAVTGLFEGRLVVAALLTVLVLATVPAGQRVRDRLTGPGFDRAVLGLLTASLVALAFDLLTGVRG